MRALYRLRWVVDLALLAALAALAGQAISNRLAADIHALPSRPRLAEPPAPSPPDRDAPDRWAAAIVERDLFDSDPPEPEPPPPRLPIEPPVDPEPPGPGGPCARADAPLALLATMVAEPAAASRAVIQEGRGSEGGRIVRPGSRLEDGVVTAIYRQRAVIHRAGAYACIELGAAPPERPRRRSKARRPGSRAKVDVSRLVKKIGTHRYRVDAGAVTGWIDDPMSVGRQIAVRPISRDGRMTGVKIRRVKRDTVFEAIGVRRGDVLTAVNGRAIDSPTRALELFEALKSSRDLVFRLERRGRPIEIEVEIR